MGLDVSINLIVGVPLLKLGTPIEMVEPVALTNHLGKPTGKKAKLKNIYLELPDARRIHIGTNEDALTDPWSSDIKFFFGGLFDDEDGELCEQWIHDCYSPHQGLEYVIIGLVVNREIEAQAESTRYEAFKGSRMGLVDGALQAVQAELLQRFGYTGELYVIAHGNYGW